MQHRGFRVRRGKPLSAEALKAVRAFFDNARRMGRKRFYVQATFPLDARKKMDARVIACGKSLDVEVVGTGAGQLPMADGGEPRLVLLRDVQFETWDEDAARELAKRILKLAKIVPDIAVSVDEETWIPLMLRSYGGAWLKKARTR